MAQRLRRWLNIDSTLLQCWITAYPANMIFCTNIGSLSIRRWPNIAQTLVQCIVLIRYTQWQISFLFIGKAGRYWCLQWLCTAACTLVRQKKGGGPRVVVSTAAFHATVRGSVPRLGGLKKTKMFLPHPRVKVSIVGSLRDREVACSASDRKNSNFEYCVWKTVSSQLSHHPQEVLLAQLSLYVHKGGLKPNSFHLDRNKPSNPNICAVIIWVQSISLCRK